MGAGRRQRTMSQLEWVLEGLSPGGEGWGADAAARMARAFAERHTPDEFVRVIRASAQEFDPLVVKSVLVAGQSARATLATGLGDMVVAITVEEDEPHRLRSCTLMPVVAPDLGERLPATFSPEQFPQHHSPGARLTVFAGLPGTGKSTLAEQLAQETGTPVFAADWLLGALTPFGGRLWDNLLDIAAEQLTHLAFRQLTLGQSVILDHPAEDVAVRERWASMARSAGARFSVILCQCEDAALHETRLSNRTRDIPGWHQTGSWANVAQRRIAFLPWTGADVLTVDASSSINDNMAFVRRFVARERDAAVG